MEDALKGKHDEEKKIADRNWLQEQPLEIYKVALHALIRKWFTAMECDGD